MLIAFIRNTRFNRVDQVVPGELAIIGDPSENREIIYGDQIGMANLSVKDDPGNKKVLNSIEMLLEGPFKHGV